MFCRYEEDMDERLDASIKRILLQNRRGAQELQLHMDESLLLQKENKILTEERQKLLQARTIKALYSAAMTRQFTAVLLSHSALRLLSSVLFD